MSSYINRIKELQHIEETTAVFMQLKDSSSLAGSDFEWNWKYNKSTGVNAQLERLKKDINVVEAYIMKKKNRQYINTELNLPFFFTYQDVESVDIDAVFNFPTRSKDYHKGKDLSASAKRFYKTLVSDVKSWNCGRPDNTVKLWVSPIKTSLRGDTFPDTFAVKAIDKTGSLCCFYFISGKFFVLPNHAGFD